MGVSKNVSEFRSRPLIFVLPQEYTRLCDHPSLHYYPSVGHDSFINTGLSEHSQDDSISMQKMALGHSFLQLADAQVKMLIFSLILEFLH